MHDRSHILHHFYRLLLEIVLNKFGEEVVHALQLDRGLRYGLPRSRKNKI